MLVSQREFERPDGWRLILEIMEKGAPVAVHVRARVTARRRHDLGRSLVEAAAPNGGWVVVNGRPDIALAVGAHAVQLGRAALGVGETLRVMEMCGRRARIGASVHDPDEAAQAVRAGADYLVLGTIYRTLSHPGLPGAGLELIRATAERLAGGVPILAIGGLNASRIDEAREAGAHGVVVGRAVWGASDPGAAALELRQELDRMEVSS